MPMVWVERRLFNERSQLNRSVSYATLLIALPRAGYLSLPYMTLGSDAMVREHATYHISNSGSIS
jgi:hypothetical protein